MNSITLKDFEKFSEVDETETEVRDLVKVVFLGDSGVGKTNIMTQFSSNSFNMNSKPTIGVDFSVKTVRTKNHIIRLQLWDTAGQERYRTFTAAYFKDAHGVILVYDVTNRESFNHVAEWLKSCLENVDLNKSSIILVGNKIDLVDQREVSEAEGRDFASSNNLLFMETSAFDNRDDCIEKAFFVLVSDIIPKYEFPENSNEPEVRKKKISTIKLNEDEVMGSDEVERKKGCCV